MSTKVPHIQSAASEDAAVHLQNFEGFPPHPGRRAQEYKVVDKPLTCNFCVDLEEDSKVPAEIDRNDLEDDDTPSSITYKVTFDKFDPVTKKVVQQIVVENVYGAQGPMSAIEIAVEEHLRVTVVQENTFVFNPGE